MTRTIFGLAAASLALALATPASAAVSVSFSNINATWYDGVLTDSNPVSIYSGNGTANAQLRWGGDSGFGLSGYNFLSAANVATSLTVPGTSPKVTLGTFQHVNLPVFPPSLSTVKLKLQADVAVDGTGVGTKNFLFDVTHDETTNNSNPCPFGGANSQGVNINGCADRVRFSNIGTSDIFTVNGVTYTLGIAGFSVNGVETSDFLTIERTTNSALLLGQVSATGGAPAVPEPATWAMMIAGFGMVGSAMRRRRSIRALA